MSRIKVLHILWSASMGGIGRVVINLCNAQLRNDHLSIGVLVAKSEGELLPQLKTLGIKIHEPGFIKGNDKSKEVLLNCKKTFEEYDILHFHSFNPSLAKLAVKSKKKIIYTEHGNFAFGRKMTIKDYIVRYFQQIFLNKQVNFITFNSEFSKNTSLKRFGLQKVKNKVVYNGCADLKKSLSINNFQRTKDEILITTIGRLAIVKRIDRLLNAFSLFDHHNTRLLIVGEGPLKEELENISREKDITKDTVFTGIKDSQSILQISDICVFPSQNEAFGLVAIEAYQQGKPVIVFADGGGLPELVNQIEPELIVNSESELAILLEKMIKEINLFNTDEKIILRKTFARKFTIEKMESELYSIYSEVFNVRN